MNPYLWVTVLFAFLAPARAQRDSESRPICFETPSSTAQCGCKTIQNKLDQLDQRVSQMFDQNQNNAQSTLNGQCTSFDQLEKRVSQIYNMLQNKADSTDSGYSTVLDRLEQRVSEMFNQHQNNTQSILNGHSAIFDQLEQRISQNIDQLLDNFNRKVTNSTQNSEQQSIGRANENHASGQYVETPFGSNWIVILERTDGAVSFERPWKDYRDGFGTVGQNFWLGLEKMHQLTKAAPYELIVEMTDSTGVERHERYDRFEIGSEDQKYPIAKLGTHSGSAGDGLSYHLSKSFSTYDNGSYISTAKAYGNGGWWYEGSWNSCLTGRWNDQTWAGIWWGSATSGGPWKSLKYVRMTIRVI